MDFTIDLPAYAGPLDLMLYLFRRQELDLTSISLSKVTEQFMVYLDLLAEMDLDGVGEFVEVASLLMEYKVKQLLPSEANADSPSEDAVLPEASEELVQRLLQYKRYRDMAAILDEQSRCWQLTVPRIASDLETTRATPDQQPIAELEIWDLVSAFGRVLRENRKIATATIVYDDTPIHAHMRKIHDRIRTQSRVELQELFPIRAHKSTLVAMFLATLELTRHHGVQAEQIPECGSIYLRAGAQFQETLELAEVENVPQHQLERSNLPILPR